MAAGDITNTVSGNIWPNGTTTDRVTINPQPNTIYGNTHPTSYPIWVNGAFRVHVEPIENGYMMWLAFAEGEEAKRFYIEKIDDIIDIVVSQTAVRKMTNGRE